MSIEEKLASMGLALPNLPNPVGNYRPAKRVGDLVFTSGQTARINGVDQASTATVKSARVKCHARPLRIWNSLLWRP